MNYLESEDSMQELREVNRATSLASLACRYGCDELDLAIDASEYLNGEGWKWYCGYH